MKSREVLRYLNRYRVMRKGDVSPMYVQLKSNFTFLTLLILCVSHRELLTVQQSHDTSLSTTRSLLGIELAQMFVGTIPDNWLCSSRRTLML
jgi:hypothetical protein